MIQLALEQPPERRNLSVGADGFSAVIKGAAFAFTADAIEWVQLHQREWYHGSYAFVS